MVRRDECSKCQKGDITLARLSEIMRLPTEAACLLQIRCGVLFVQCFRAATRKPTIVCSPNAFAASSTRFGSNVPLRLTGT
jgi:hypothetical protein